MVRKKSNRALWLILGVLIIAVIFASQQLTLDNSLIGGDIISVDKVSFTSTGGTVDKYLVDIVVNGGGESVEGTITRDKLAEAGLSENFPEGEFKLSLELNNFACKFDLIEDEAIYKLYYSSAGEGCLAKAIPVDKIGMSTTKQSCIDKSYQDPKAIAVNKGYQGVAPLQTGNCNSLVSINTLSAWMPEEGTFIKGDFDCWYHESCPSQYYEVCHGADCYDSYAHLIAGWNTNADVYRNSFHCCQTTTSTQELRNSGECAEDGDKQGDWVSTHIGGVPFLKSYRIGTATTFDYELVIKITNSAGVTETMTLTPEQSEKVLNNVKAKVTGSFIGQSLCELTGVDYTVVQDISVDGTTTGNKFATNGVSTHDSNYKFVEKFNVQLYEAELNDLAGLDIDHFVFRTETEMNVISHDPAVGGDQIFTRQSDLNNKLWDMWKSADKKPECDIRGAFVYCNPLTPPIYPNLQLVIDADFIGVHLSKGAVSILGVDKPVVVTANTQSLFEVEMKNIGEDDSFSVYVECGTTKNIPVLTGIYAGQIKTVTIPVLMEKAGENTCVLHAIPQGDPSAEETYDMILDVEQSQIVDELINEQNDLKIKQQEDANLLTTRLVSGEIEISKLKAELLASGLSEDEINAIILEKTSMNGLTAEQQDFISKLFESLSLQNQNTFGNFDTKAGLIEEKLEQSKSFSSYFEELKNTLAKFDKEIAETTDEVTKAGLQEKRDEVKSIFDNFGETIEANELFEKVVLEQKISLLEQQKKAIEDEITKKEKEGADKDTIDDLKEVLDGIIKEIGDTTNEKNNLLTEGDYTYEEYQAYLKTKVSFLTQELTKVQEEKNNFVKVTPHDGSLNIVKDNLIWWVLAISLLIVSVLFYFALKKKGKKRK